MEAYLAIGLTNDIIFRVASFTKQTLMRAVGLSLWIYGFLVREIASSDIDCTANTQEACEQCQEVNVSVDCYWKNNRCNQLVWTDLKRYRPLSRVGRIAITSCYYQGSTANVALRHLGEQNYDILLVFSVSGESSELNSILKYANRHNISVIGVSCKSSSKND